MCLHQPLENKSLPFLSLVGTTLILLCRKVAHVSYLDAIYFKHHLMNSYTLFLSKDFICVHSQYFFFFVCLYIYMYKRDSNTLLYITFILLCWWHNSFRGYYFWSNALSFPLHWLQVFTKPYHFFLCSVDPRTAMGLLYGKEPSVFHLNPVV